VSPTFTSFRYRNYRLWFAGALVANTGTWMQRVAQDWLVLTVLSADSGLAVGIVTGLQFLPILLLTPYAGLVADRLPRRRILVATQSAQGVLAVGLGALVLAGVAELWMVYVFALLLGVASAFDGPVRQTFVAQLVPTESLPNAVALNSGSFNAARMIGPALAGLLFAAVGPGWVFIANGVSFGATILALVAMRSRDLLPMPRTARARGQLRAGLAHVREHHEIVLIIVLVGVVSAFGLNFQLTSAVMARTEFGLGPEQYGLLGTLLAAGSVVGALVAARREHPSLRVVLMAALGFGSMMALQSVAPHAGWYAAACVPLGFFSLTMLTSANATVQLATDAALRGRVMALYMSVFLGATTIGSPVVGWVAEVWGPRWSVAVGAIATIAAAVVLGIRAARISRVRLRIRPRPHLYPVGGDGLHPEGLRPHGLRGDGLRGDGLRGDGLRPHGLRGDGSSGGRPSEAVRPGGDAVPRDARRPGEVHDSRRAT
jgi:MFS family permease